MRTTHRTNLETAERQYLLKREFDAPRNLVYAAWTDPRHLARWWGPHGMTNPVCQVDLRPGGAYRIEMLSSDGKRYPLKGVIEEIVPARRLVMTMDTEEHPPEWHRELDAHRRGVGAGKSPRVVTTVLFDEESGRTRITMKQVFESDTDRDAFLAMGSVDGWSQSFERLDALLEENQNRSGIGGARRAPRSGQARGGGRG